MKKLNILMVDDDTADRKMLRRMIVRSGMAAAIHEVGDAPEALAFQGGSIDLVLLDQRLPGAEGLSILESLTGKWPQAAVILMTGQGDEFLAKTAIKRGAVDYISKRDMNQNAVERMMKVGVETAHMRWMLDQQRQELLMFSNILVHDFKAPINAISSLSDLLAESISKGETDTVLEDLAFLRKSTRQMAELVDSLADHIRFDRDQQMQEVPVREVIDRALTALRLAISESGATVDIDLPEGPEMRLNCSAPQISQLLQNLIANGIKFCRDRRPELCISVCAQPPASLLISVADNGIGVPDHFHEKMFDPFQRLGNVGDIPGSGLGLATCRKIAERHAGRIWSNRREGPGAEICLLLPADPCHAGAHEMQSAAQPERTGTGRLLN